MSNSSLLIRHKLKLLLMPAKSDFTATNSLASLSLCLTLASRFCIFSSGSLKYLDLLRGTSSAFLHRGLSLPPNSMIHRGLVQTSLSNDALASTSNNISERASEGSSPRHPPSSAIDGPRRIRKGRECRKERARRRLSHALSQNPDLRDRPGMRTNAALVPPCPAVTSESHAYARPR